MRRKSTRASTKTTEKSKQQEPTTRQTRRSRRHKVSESASGSDASDEEKPKCEVTPTNDTNSNQLNEEITWKVTKTESPSGEIQKLKISVCRTSPSTPERAKRGRNKSSSQTEDDSATEDISKRAQLGSPVKIQEEVMEEKEDKKGKGKSKGKTKQKIENSPQISEIEPQKQYEISENVQVTPQSPSDIDKPIDTETIQEVESENKDNEKVMGTETIEEVESENKDNEKVTEDVNKTNNDEELNDQTQVEESNNEAVKTEIKYDNDQIQSDDKSDVKTNNESVKLEIKNEDTKTEQNEIKLDLKEEIKSETPIEAFENTEMKTELKNESTNEVKIDKEEEETKPVDDNSISQAEKAPSVEEENNVEKEITEKEEEKEVPVAKNEDDTKIKKCYRLVLKRPKKDTNDEPMSVDDAEKLDISTSKKEEHDKPLEDITQTPEENEKTITEVSDNGIDISEKMELETTTNDEIPAEITKSPKPAKKKSQPIKLKRNSVTTMEEEVPNINQHKRKWFQNFNPLDTVTSNVIKIDYNLLKNIYLDVELLEEKDVRLDLVEMKDRRVSIDKKLERKISETSDIHHSVNYERQTSYNSTKSDVEMEETTNIIAMNRKISIVDDSASKLKPPPSPAKNPVSSVLYITNLVRPFTLKQLKELLERTGKIVEDGFWTDRIKSKCYIQYETQEEAESTRNALHGVHWPIGNGKKLIIDYATMEDLEMAKNPPPKPQEVSVPEKENHEPVEKVEEKEERRKEPHIREWDVGKEGIHVDRPRSRSRDRGKRIEKRRHSRHSPSPSEDFISRKQKKMEEAVPQKLMDDLFQKTKAMPSIYWQPLTPEEIATKQQQRLQRMAEHKRRMEETSRTRSDYSRGGPNSRRRYD